MTKEEIQAMVREAMQAEIAPLLETQRKYSQHFTEPEQREDPREKGMGFARAVRSIIYARKFGGTPAQAAQKFYPRNEKLIRALSESTGTEGGFLVPTEYSSDIIECLRPKAVMRKMGCVILPMNSNTMGLSKITAGSVATYEGENSHTPSTEPTFGLLRMQAKKLKANVPISNDLLRDASPSVDQVVRTDLIRAMATKEDLAFIRYNGTEHKPSGILYQVNSANKRDSGGKTYDKIDEDALAIIGKVQDSDNMMDNCGWIMNPRSWRGLFGAMNANGVYLYRDELKNGTFFGYPYATTTQIPVNLGPAGDESEVYFGNFADAVIGENEQLLVDISNEATYWDGTQLQSAWDLDQTLIRVIARHDFKLRHDKAFAVLEKVKWGT